MSRAKGGDSAGTSRAKFLRMTAHERMVNSEQCGLRVPEKLGEVSMMVKAGPVLR